MRMDLQTFGYEGLSIDVFVDRLLEAGTTLIIDVRANPLSRKRGFSKKALSEFLERAGIRYVHRPLAGCPKAVRDQYREDSDWRRYTRGFMAHLSTIDAEVDAIAGLTDGSTACLICFEEDHNFCHRTYVARAVAAKTGQGIQHLRVRGSFVDRAELAVA